MGFLSRLFSKSTEQCLAKGDDLLASQRYFDARTAYEEGLQRLSGSGSDEQLVQTLHQRISSANTGLAELNFHEAEAAARRGETGKALEYLNLAKTLTEDVSLREKAEILAASLEKVSNAEQLVVPRAGCGSCGSGGHAQAADAVLEEPDLTPLEYYDLLIRQLPPVVQARYEKLGEDFALAFLAASRDEHQVALELLEAWVPGNDRDIHLYERGKVLFRLGRISQAEACFRDAISAAESNPLPHLGLALLLLEQERFEEAALQLDTMVARNMLTEQALLLRGEVFQHQGDLDGALDSFAKLLTTPAAKQAAERVYGILMQTGRQQEAAQVFKKYLGGCCH